MPRPVRMPTTMATRPARSARCPLLATATASNARAVTGGFSLARAGRAGGFFAGGRFLAGAVLRLALDEPRERAEPLLRFVVATVATTLTAATSATGDHRRGRFAAPATPTAARRSASLARRPAGR